MKSTFNFLAVLLIAIFCGQQVRAQLSGTITVPSATYPTLDSVIRTLNLQGVGVGGATINLTAGNPQTAPVGGYVLGSTVLNASLLASKPLIINGNSNTVTAFTGTGSTDGMFYIAGADFVTINALNLSEATANTTTTTQMEWGYSLVKLNAAAPFDGCQNVTISGCTISLNSGNTSIGIRGAHTQAASSGTLATTGAVAADANSKNFFAGNTISNCNTAISLTGIASSGVCDVNNIIGNPGQSNTITIGGSSSTAYGIRTANDSVVTIQNNNFSVASAQSTTTYMIYPGVGKGDLNIQNNGFNVNASMTTTHLYVLYNYNSSNGGHQDANAVFRFNKNTISGANAAATSGYLYGMYNYYSTFYADSITNNVVTNVNWGTSSSSSYLYMFYNYYGSTPYVYVKGNVVSNITKTSTGSSGYIYAYYIYNYPATTGTLTFTNNLLQNVTTNYYVYGMYTSAGYTSSPAVGVGQAYVNKNNKIDQVVITQSGYLYGHYATNGSAGADIAFDTITNCRTNTGGIYAIYKNTAAGDVHDNYVANDTTATSTIYGIYHTNGVNTNIYNNRVSGLTVAGASGNLYGLYYSSGTTNGNVYNNQIADFKTPIYSGSSIYGMYLSTAIQYNIYHNTIRFNHTSTGANLGTAGIYYSSSATGLDLRNNIINVNVVPAGTGVVTALVRSAGTAGVVPANYATTSNGNIFYVPNITNAFIYAENYATPVVNSYSLTSDASFNTACGLYKTFMAPRESASFLENNLTQTNGLYAPTGTSFAKSNGVATSSPVVTVDINGVTRPANPDCGALQFTAAGLDAAPPVIVYNALPGTTYCTSAPSLTATITDASGVNATTNAPRLYYKRKVELDSFGTYPSANIAAFNGWKYVTATNSGSSFTFAIDYTKLTSAPAVGDTILYFIVAQDNAATPNVGSSSVSYATGYCPGTVNLGTAAGPTSNAAVKNYFTVLAQPALATISPATSSMCQGLGVKLTANPVSVPVSATIGTGVTQNTNMTYPAPYGNWYTGARHQMLILASELQAMGLSAGNLTSLSFSVATPYGSYTNFAISLGNTTQTAMTTTFLTGLTQVYSAATYTPVAGWNAHTFTTPFYWDGVSNLVVETAFSNCLSCGSGNICNSTNYTNNAVMNQSVTPFVSTAYYYSDGSSCMIATITTASSTIAQRPNMMLSGNKKMAINWTPYTNLYKDSLMTQAMGAADTNTIVYAKPATTTNYATVNVFNGCSSSASSTPAVVNIIPAPSTVTTPAGSASFCGGSNTTIAGPTGTGLSYQWMQGSTAISGATASSYTTGSVGTYALKVTNTSTGCSATSSAVNVINTPAPLASATASGSTTVCGGGIVTLNANAGTGLSYQWMKSGAVVTGATGSSYGATATGNYAVIVSAAANCSTTSTAVPVTVNVINTTVTASGATTFCTGGNVLLSVPTAASQTYQWMQGGTNISGATGATYAASATGNYTVQVNNATTGCMATSTPAVSVTVGSGPASAFTPTGTIGICSGNSTTLSTTAASGVSYQWQLNGSPIAGATNITYVANTSGNYTLVASISPTCQTTSTATSLVVNPLPAVTTTPSGNAGVCQGSSIALNVPSGNGFTYQWKQGGTNIVGATNSTYNASVAGNYTVAVANTQTTCAATSSNIVLSVNSLPAASATNTSALTVCQGDSVGMAANTGTGFSYQWQKNGNNIAAANNSAFLAYQSGNYTVVVTNANNCSVTSQPIAVTVNPLPMSVISYTSPVIFCEGGAVVFTSADTSTNLSYQWNRNGVPVYGANAYSDIVYQTGIYSIKVTNGYGCSATSQPVSVTVNALPSPVITHNGDGSFTTNPGFATYQWYFDGQAITGATTDSVMPVQNGLYWVAVSDGNGCINTSPQMFMNNVGVVSVMTSGDDIRLFPNPTQQFVNIDAPVKVDVMVRDLQGRMVMIQKEAKRVDVSPLANGVYMFMILDQNGMLLKAEKVFKSE
ncbi:T9SS type A sorting domain-containing protein [Taibaiella soli]|nr:T9SS type A sorting domain-containing protein [Taibaiella soli]